MHQIPNWQNSEWTLDNIENGQNLEWTRPQIYQRDRQCEASSVVCDKQMIGRIGGSLTCMT